MLATVYLALGSNLGNREQFLRRARQELQDGGVAIECCSSVRETHPVGGPPQQRFLNSVLRAKTWRSAPDLLRMIQSIERKLGRVKTMRNGPRTIDIDILLYDFLSFHSPSLTIPHPRMFTRPFVLEPLKEVLDPKTKEFLHACYNYR